MVEKKISVLYPMGFHAQPAAMIVSEARKYPAEIRIITEKANLDAKSIIMVLGAGIKSGESVTFKVTGEDEKRVLDNLIKLIEKEKIGAVV